MINYISIIVPFYKGEQFYPILLDSILLAIEECNNQPYKFEIITIIDSEESDLEALKTQKESFFKKLPNVTFQVQKNEYNIGVAASRNVGLNIGNGNCFHMIDQDDAVTKDFYKETFRLLKDYNFILTNGIVNYYDQRFNSHKLYYFKVDLSIKGLLKDDYIRSPGQVVFSKKLVENIRFPEPKQYKGADDRFFWLGLFIGNSAIIKPYYLAEPLYIASIHDHNYSADQLNLRKSSLENWKMFKTKFDTSKYTAIINADINSLKFSANEKMNFFARFSGMYNRFHYFFNLNKIVRFYFKRTRF
jgi:hypothetical protein